MKTLYPVTLLVVLVFASCQSPIDQQPIPQPMSAHRDIPELPTKHYKLLYPGYKLFPYFEDFNTIYRPIPKPGEGGC